MLSLSKHTRQGLPGTVHPVCGASIARVLRHAQHERIWF